MPKYEPSPLDESRHRFDAQSAEAVKVANRKIIFGVVIGALCAVAIVVILLIAG